MIITLDLCIKLILFQLDMPPPSYGEGNGTIWLSNVACVETERVLINCSSNPRGINSCTHDQDVGVKCSSGNIIDLRYS